jgi:nucleotide-binding universal stress UspA family protein
VVDSEETGGAAGVVVGVDGSPGARAALVWALADAARRGARLQVVSAFPVDIYWGDAMLIDERRIEAFRADTEGRVRALVDEVRSQSGAGAAAVDVAVAPGPATQVVLAAAEGAALLVVGSRGRGPVRSTVLGSVALHAATHARCPVVVVHPRADTGSAPRRVVVGVDGSDGSRAALAHAVAEAERLDADVTVIAAYTLRSYWSGAYQASVPPVERLREAVRSDAEAMVSQIGAPTTVGVRVLPVEGPAGDTLVRAAEGADLLVVGGRGRGAVRGMLLGSVALHCVINAPCPVMVVPVGRAGAAVG